MTVRQLGIAWRCPAPHWSDAYGTDSGPSQGEPCAPGIRPTATSPLAANAAFIPPQRGSPTAAFTSEIGMSQSVNQSALRSAITTWGYGAASGTAYGIAFRLTGQPAKRGLNRATSIKPSSRVERMRIGERQRSGHLIGIRLPLNSTTNWGLHLRDQRERADPS
jgi:hypothetical protein